MQHPLALTLLGLVALQAGMSWAQIDFTMCGWVHGTNKNTEWCPNNYVATGACASKGSKSCDNRSSFSIRCCQLTNAYSTGRYNCHTAAGNKGVDVSCPYGQAVYGTCASLDFGRCPYNGRQLTTSVECCDSSASLKVSPTDCFWYYADKPGTHIACPNGQVMTGRCGSESFANCQRGKKVAGVKCCAVIS